MSKYKNRRTLLNGIWFDSAKEAAKYQELQLLEKAGLITNLERQPVFRFSVRGNKVLIKSKGYPNGRQASYRADFAYFDQRKNKRVILDVKGMRTDIFKLKKALTEAMFDVEIEEC